MFLPHSHCLALLFSVVTAYSAAQMSSRQAPPIHPLKPVGASATGNGVCGLPFILTMPNQTPPASGWPHSFPPLSWQQDAVYLRDGKVVSGKLAFLEAFATVQQESSKKNYSRDEVGFVLICGARFPQQFASMPNNDDSLVLNKGSVIVGHVNVDGAGIHVKGQTFQRKDVSLIHLKGSADTQFGEPDDITPADQNAATLPGAQNTTPGTTAPSNLPAGKGPERIPWGQALWRGNVRFKDTISRRPPGSETFSGTYYVTWKEEKVSTLFVSTRENVYHTRRWGLHWLS
jgi:hypothetical protein